MLYQVGTLTGEHVDDRYLYHRVASGLLAQRCACHVHQHLTGEGGIVDLHVKLKELEEKQQLQDLNLNLLDTYSKILVTGKQIELYKQILELQEKNLELKTRLCSAKEISTTELNDEAAQVSQLQGKISELYQIYTESLNWLAFYTGEEYNTEELTIE